MVCLTRELATRSLFLRPMETPNGEPMTIIVQDWYLYIHDHHGTGLLNALGLLHVMVKCTKNALTRAKQKRQ